MNVVFVKIVTAGISQIFFLILSIMFGMYCSCTVPTANESEDFEYYVPGCGTFTESKPSDYKSVETMYFIVFSCFFLSISIALSIPFGDLNPIALNCKGVSAGAIFDLIVLRSMLRNLRYCSKANKQNKRRQ